MMSSPTVLLLLLVISIVATVTGLRCKCTKESETVKCYEGVCETEQGSCLMLDHPTMGVHYTCHTRGLQNGHCHNRTSKSGVSVRICGCNEEDFCNYSLWPEKIHHHHHKTHHKEAHTAPISRNSAAKSLLTFSIPLFLYQLFISL